MMDINRWLSFIDLPRDLNDLISLLNEAVHTLLEPTLILQQQKKEIKNFNLLLNYFSSWNRQREVCAVFHYDDFKHVLGSMGLSRFKFRSQKELPILKRWCDLNLIHLPEFISLLQQQLSQSPSSGAGAVAAPESADGKERTSYPFLITLSQMILQSEQTDLMNLKTVTIPSISLPQAEEGEATEDIIQPLDSSTKILFLFRSKILQTNFTKEKFLQIFYNILTAPSLSSPSPSDELPQQQLSDLKKSPQLTPETISSLSKKKISLEEFQLFSSAFGFHFTDQDDPVQHSNSHSSSDLHIFFHKVFEMKRTLLAVPNLSVESKKKSSTSSDQPALDDLMELFFFPLKGPYQVGIEILLKERMGETDIQTTERIGLTTEPKTATSSKVGGGSITVSQFLIALCRVLLPSEQRETFLEIDAINQQPLKKSRIRRTQRLLGLTTGDVGGNQILSTDNLAIKIQSRFRSW
jgi:hypothetical protein